MHSIYDVRTRRREHEVNRHAIKKDTEHVQTQTNSVIFDKGCDESAGPDKRRYSEKRRG